MIHTVSRIRIAVWIAIGGISAVLGTENWSSFNDILIGRYNDWPQEINRYYTSPSSNSVPYICSGIFYYDVPGVGITPVGGFDVFNGLVVNSYFLGFGEAYTANTGAGANPGNSGYGYWEVFYDYNGDGILGTQLAGFIDNRVEQLDASQFSITNFTPWGPTSATFEFHMTDPTVVLPIGSIAVNRVGTTNVIGLAVSTAGTLAGGLSIQYKNSLTNVSWKLLSSHNIPTNASLVSAVDTNAVSSRFYRAIAPR